MKHQNLFIRAFKFCDRGLKCGVRASTIIHHHKSKAEDFSRIFFPRGVLFFTDIFGVEQLKKNSSIFAQQNNIFFFVSPFFP